MLFVYIDKMIESNSSKNKLFVMIKKLWYHIFVCEYLNPNYISLLIL